jgi:hypothetical protein
MKQTKSESKIILIKSEFFEVQRTKVICFSLDFQK